VRPPPRKTLLRAPLPPPPQDLRVKPSKPLYFYLVSLLRIKEQLEQCQNVIEEAGE
jgi:hypothetical protein